ncbi:NAD(P)-dependent oxidoreductase [Bacteroides congonensis]|uniref:NAD-dependent epimerase/dehydratase family protein n=1 Tax=Bacteroides congonensis TaxID=1871006 RepID=UPI00321997D4
MSKILVTGGLGVVGTPLVEELRRRGNEVWVCDLSHNHHANYIRCDISEYRQLENIFDKHQFDYVYNLAAEFGRWNGEDFYEKVWKSNAVGCKNVIRFQEKYKFKLIHFSSSEVYGDYDDVMYEKVMDEKPIKQMNDYAISKWVNEMQIKNSELMFGTETVRVRLFNTYGPGEYFSSYRSVICMFCYKALHDMPYTVYTGHHRTNTYIDDCVNALANICINFKAGEVYNIASSEYYDIKTISDYVLKAAGKTDKLVEYKEFETQTTLDKKVDNAKSVADLGMKTTVGLEEGIARNIAWMKEIYNVR